MLGALGSRYARFDDRLKVATDRKAMIVSGTEEGEVLGAESIVANNLRSILAVPVSFREKFIGVLYLDSTLAKGIFTEADLEIVTAMGHHIAIGIEMALLAQVAIENQALKKDLEVTAAVQSLILPKKSTVDLDDLKMAAFYKAANQSGGDWWWYDYDQERGVFRVLMGDVTGHGAGPAMISAAVSGIYQAFTEMRGQNQGLGDFLRILNRALFRLASEKYLLSMNAFEINLATGRVDYLAAGTPPMVVIHPSGEWDFVEELGSWLGTQDLGIGQRSYQLAPGDRIALFTDGLYEIKINGDNEFGLNRLAKVLSQTREQPVDRAINSLNAKVVGQEPARTPEDDISFVLLDYRPRAVGQQVAI